MPCPGSKGFIGRDLLALVLISAITITLYSHTLGSPFVLDDAENIRNNPNNRISTLTWDSLYNAAFKSLRSKRPLSNISLAFNYYIGGYNVLGYHLFNILIHVASGVVLYLFIQVTLRIHSPSPCHDRFVPLIVALLWVVHPVQTQAVTYIIQRMTSMAAFFYLLSMFLYVKARMHCLEDNPQTGIGKRGYPYVYYLGSLLSGVSALCSKENAATLPFFLFLYEWFFFQNLDRKWLKQKGIWFGGIFILFLFLVMVYTSGNPVEKILSQYDTRNFTMEQRLLTETRVVIFYITLLCYPHPSRLNLDHDFPLSVSLLDPVTTLLSLVVLAGLMMIAIRIAKKEKVLSFGILWFFGNLVMESSVIGLEIIFEHRLYLPSMLVFVMPVCFLCHHIKTEWIGKGILCIAIALFSFWTYQRNAVWKNEVSIFTDSVRKSSDKERPHTNLGAALIRAGKHEEAGLILSRAVRLNPESAVAHNNYGVALSLGGNINEAIHHFEEAIRLLSIFQEAKSNLKKAFEYREMETQILNLKETIRQHPGKVKLYRELGDLMKSKGDLEGAIQWYEEALSIQPDQIEILKTLSLMKAMRGEYDSAISLQKQILEIQPGNAEACYSIASVYARKNQVRLSVQWLERAIHNGFHNPERVKTDPNLQQIQGTVAFKTMMAQWKQNDQQKKNK